MNKVRNTFYSLAIGDALGVPVEFSIRNTLRQSPVVDMFGFGTHNQPKGTFSDDTSMTFCLAESLIRGYDLNDIGRGMINWLNNAYWTANNVVFDYGITTKISINKLVRGTSPLESGETFVGSNGNGSLMRIYPLMFHIKDLPIEERFRIVSEVSSITHAHTISVVSCFYFLEYCRMLFDGHDKHYSFQHLKTLVGDFLKNKIDDDFLKLFDNLLRKDIYEFSEDEINSSGYVLHTLEASVWCILTTENYQDTLLKAVNLGEDTDTTGCVTGVMTGLIYPFEDIPQDWVDSIARKDDIEDLIKRFQKKFDI
jgi:ADP-ribosyl-[dinitrogen reductase] hydrolase